MPEESQNGSAQGVGVTGALLEETRRHFDLIAQDFNAATDDESIKVRLSPLVAAKKTNAKEPEYQRYLVSTAFWALAVRGLNGVVEIFRFPSTELLLPGTGETAAHLRVSMRWNNSQWIIDGVPMASGEIEIICKTLFRDVVTSSYRDAHAVPEYVRLPLLAGDESFVGRVKRLVTEKNNLLERVVTEQERTQRQISRDLHDAVISNLMTLCSSLSGATPPTPEQITARIEDAIKELRAVCQNLAPRDLKDWGLQTVIGDLLNTFSERTGIDCTMESSGPWPQMPEVVEIHLFRIVQECLNNVEKHAQAKNVALGVDASQFEFKLSVRDDGRGFRASDSDAPKGTVSTGWGADIIRERIDLIRQYYPCILSVSSQEGQGSVLFLTLRLDETTCEDQK